MSEEIFEKYYLYEQILDKVSFGILIVNEEDDAELLERTDSALYLAKNSGKNQVSIAG